MKYIPITINWEKRYEAKAWCVGQFGASKKNTRVWTDMQWWAQPVNGKYTRKAVDLKCDYRFYFLNPEHATMFKLRFSK